MKTILALFFGFMLTCQTASFAADRPEYLASFDPAKAFKPARTDLTEIFLQIAGSLECYGSPEPYLRHMAKEHERIEALYLQKNGKAPTSYRPAYMTDDYINRLSKNWNLLSPKLGLEPFATRRLAVMNLAIRGITADFGPEHADTFRRDLHPDLRADYVLTNPPFNDSDTALRGSAFLQTGGKLQVMAERHDNFRKDDDVRWQFGVPPKGNANFAWVQHFIHHLAPHGMDGFVLANGSMSSNQSSEGDIRRALIEADLVDCMVALPGQLFYSTLASGFWQKAKPLMQSGGFRDRRAHRLRVNVRKMGTLIERVHREMRRFPSGAAKRQKVGRKVQRADANFLVSNCS